MDNLVGILLLIVGFVIYIVAYLLVPWIVSASAKLQKSSIDFIVISNAAIIFLLFQIINPNITANLTMSVITLYIARKRLISKCLIPSMVPSQSGASLTMNPQMGKKWFFFYARVRPWFTFVSFLALFVSFVQYPFTFANSAALLIYCLVSLIQTCMAYRVALWSRREYETFVSIVEDVIFFETISIPYQVAVIQYRQNGNNLNASIAIGIVILILTYLLWYRLNIKYFHKRLFSLPNDVSVSAEASSTNKQLSQVTAHKVKPTPITSAQPAKSIRYCSRCGKPINPSTKKCQGCGKQYFKGISIKTVAPYVLLFVAVSSMVWNICLFLRIDNQTTTIQKQQTEIATYKIRVDDLEDQVDELEKDKNTWYNYWKRNYEKVDFFDENVVLIEDDGTSLYHKYDCSKFKGHYFWAYNIDAAEDWGYKPCPECHK